MDLPVKVDIKIYKANKDHCHPRCPYLKTDQDNYGECILLGDFPSYSLSWIYVGSGTGTTKRFCRSEDCVTAEERMGW